MNMQQIMAQAQKMQRDIMSKKEKLDAMSFEGKSEWVTVKFNGKKEITELEITCDDAFEKENKEILTDMLILAIKDVMNKIDKETENQMGEYSKMGGLF